MQTPRLFVDMDGTLAVFQPVDTYEQLYERGFFENALPHTNVVNAVRGLIKSNPGIEVFTLSAVLSDSEYALEEKTAWLDRYLPELDKAHRLFVPNGQKKSLVIPGGQRASDVLLDDYSANLFAWDPPGHGIKLLNGINHTHGSWKGATVEATAGEDDISHVLVTEAFRPEHERIRLTPTVKPTLLDDIYVGAEGGYFDDAVMTADAVDQHGTGYYLNWLIPAGNYARPQGDIRCSWYNPADVEIFRAVDDRRIPPALCTLCGHSFDGMEREMPGAELHSLCGIGADEAFVPQL